MSYLFENYIFEPILYSKVKEGKGPKITKIILK